MCAFDSSQLQREFCRLSSKLACQLALGENIALTHVPDMIAGFECRLLFYWHDRERFEAFSDQLNACETDSVLEFNCLSIDQIPSGYTVVCSASNLLRQM